MVKTGGDVVHEPAAIQTQYSTVGVWKVVFDSATDCMGSNAHGRMEGEVSKETARHTKSTASSWWLLVLLSPRLISVPA